MPNIADIIQQMLVLVKDHNKWSQGAMARFSTGEECDLRHWSRRRVCLNGALQLVLDSMPFVSPSSKSDAYQEVCRALLETAGWKGAGLSNLNDNIGHATMVSILERTIKKHGLFEAPLKVESRRERMMREPRVLAPQFGGFVRNQRKK